MSQGRFHKNAPVFILFILSIAFTALSVTSLVRKSPTCDETGHHIASGYIFLTKGDFSFSTEVPPLSRYIMALPLLALELELPDERSFWAREDRGEFSREFIYDLNREKAAKIVLFSRLPIVVIGLLGGFFLFFWTRRHYGDLTVVLAAFMYFLCPNMIAHSSLATTDMTATVFIMLSVFCMWDFLENPCTWRAMFSGVTLGLALLSKFTAVFLLPAYILVSFGLFFKYREEERSRFGKAMRTMLFLVFPAAFFILWAGYLFELRPLLEGAMRASQKEGFFLEFLNKIFPSAGTGLTDLARKFLYSVPVPLSSFWVGIAGIARHSAEGTRNFFMGSWSAMGNPIYYAAAFIIKTPIPVVIAFFTGTVLVFTKREKRDLNLYLLFFAVMFFVAASRSNLQLGLRYVLPAYPMIFVIAALGMGTLLKGGKILNFLGAGLVVWTAVLHFFVWPDYLSYFNELVGGTENGYLYLRDSNLDWGQDLPALKSYMDKNGIKEVRLVYFGTADPSYYGVKHIDVNEEEREFPQEAVYAVSAQYLESLGWTKHEKVSATAGGSILIYDMRKK